jgi:translation elongation factor EF-Tu-like GTPase
MMYVEDVFSIPGRGTVATGKVERGTITKGAELELVGFGSKLKTTLTGIGESAGALWLEPADMCRNVPQGA